MGVAKPRPHARSDFHALWWHPGPFGRQGVHMHPCLVHEDCKIELEGDGVRCNPRDGGHRQVRWLISKGWVPIGASAERPGEDES